MGNENFDYYYQLQFKDVLSTEQYQDFKNTLLEKLPVTFRVNPSLMRHETVVEMLRDPKFIQEYATEQSGGQE